MIRGVDGRKTPRGGKMKVRFLFRSWSSYSLGRAGATFNRPKKEAPDTKAPVCLTKRFRCPLTGDHFRTNVFVPGDKREPLGRSAVKSSPKAWERKDPVGARNNKIWGKPTVKSTAGAKKKKKKKKKKKNN